MRERDICKVDPADKRRDGIAVGGNRRLREKVFERHGSASWVVDDVVIEALRQQQEVALVQLERRLALASEPAGAFAHDVEHDALPREDLHAPRGGYGAPAEHDGVGLDLANPVVGYVHSSQPQALLEGLDALLWNEDSGTWSLIDVGF